MSSPEDFQLPLIHVGFYKAASTWLQKCFFLQQSGYHQLANPFEIQSLLIQPGAEEFDAQAARQIFARGIRRAAERDLIPVLTAEALSGDMLRGGGNAPLYADRLCEVFGGARILIVVREQRALIRSMYKTMVLMGENRSPEELLKRGGAQRRPSFDLDFIRFDQLVGEYRRRFGEAAVLVLPYESFRAAPRDFLDRVRAHSGLPPLSDGAYDTLPVESPMNTNESLAYLYLQRWLNRLMLTHWRDYSGPMGWNHKRVWKRMAWHKRRAGDTRFDPGLERQFADTVAELTAGVFAASNRRLQEMCDLDLAALGYEMSSEPG